MREYAIAKGCANPERAFEAFRDKSLAGGYTYADWEAAWRMWGWKADERYERQPAAPRQLMDADEYVRQMKAAK
jgi:hypothetical protein